MSPQQQLPSKGWSSVPDPEKLVVQPKQTATSAPLCLEAFKTMAAEHDTLGAFSLPIGDVRIRDAKTD
jgi:hypothetical protein